MKIKIAILFIIIALVLSGCFAGESAAPLQEVIPVATTPRESSRREPKERIQRIKQDEAPTEALSPQQLAQKYFSVIYRSYITFEDADLRWIMDFSQQHNHTFKAWTSAMNQRRRLLWQTGLCFVDDEEKPYTITFLSEAELEDNRLSFWQDMYPPTATPTNEEILIHFIITGEEGEAYPPFMSINAQQTIKMRSSGINGEWKIVWHYYPGAVRSFRNPNIQLESLSDDEALAKLYEEFAEAVDLPESEVYNGTVAANYALKYIKDANPDFYKISDWMGNCANFVSQCIWAGLHGDSELTAPLAGKYMNNTWFAGGGGGSPAWENVEHQWNYVISAMKPELPANINSLAVGDILQTRTLGENRRDGFSHAMILVDKERMMLAQNSPSSLAYYSDMLNNEYRFYRPTLG